MTEMALGWGFLGSLFPFFWYFHGNFQNPKDFRKSRGSGFFSLDSDFSRKSHLWSMGSPGSFKPFDLDQSNYSIKSNKSHSMTYRGVLFNKYQRYVVLITPEFMHAFETYIFEENRIVHPKWIFSNYQQFSKNLKWQPKNRHPLITALQDSRHTTTFPTNYAENVFSSEIFFR